MPIYEYECSACQTRTEILQRIKDPVKTVCPLCEQETLAKVFSAKVNFELKGEGFYNNDYKES